MESVPLPLPSLAFLKGVKRFCVDMDGFTPGLEVPLNVRTLEIGKVGTMAYESDQVALMMAMRIVRFVKYEWAGKDVHSVDTVVRNRDADDEDLDDLGLHTVIAPMLEKVIVRSEIQQWEHLSTWRIACFGLKTVLERRGLELEIELSIGRHLRPQQIAHRIHVRRQSLVWMIKWKIGWLCRRLIRTFRRR